MKYSWKGWYIFMMKQLINAALGKAEPDIIFKNATVVDVFTHKLIQCDVAVSCGKIAGLGTYSGTHEVDCTDKYLMPSFIDSHLHIESSMLSPSEYAKIVVPKGVTTIIADPHEIANVCGEKGLKYMIDSAKSVPLDILYMLPSCVPATPFDSSGARIGSAATKRLMEEYEFLGLGEMMDYTGVISANDETLAKIECADICDGHGPMLTGKELCAYASTGILTDHECVTAEEALEKIRLGMYVQIREGTSAKNLSELIKAIDPYTLRRILFCTDDKHINHIIETGTISNCVGKAISLGIDPIDAITIATLNPADCYGLKKKGAIAPGYVADLLICEDISAQNILEVYKDGNIVARNGKALFEKIAVSHDDVINTVHIKEFTAEAFELEFTPGMPVIKVMPDTLVTAMVNKDTREGLNYCAVIERHKSSGNVGLAWVDGFALKRGAIAQSIGHDSHNITVVGSNPEDMAVAVNALGTEGGITVACDGKIIAKLALPIAGLMSDLPAETVNEENARVVEAAMELRDNHDVDIFMMLSFISLFVIPEIRLNDSGLFNVLEQKYI